MEIARTLVSRAVTTAATTTTATTKPAAPATPLTPALNDAVVRNVLRIAGPVTNQVPTSVADPRRTGPIMAPFDPGRLGVEVALPKPLAIGILGERAKAAGLSEAEAQKLQSILTNSKDYAADAKFVRDLLGTENPARALRTFNDLDGMRKQHPDRITGDVMRALTLGVGEARTSATQGREGILGKTQAMKAAEALVNMPANEYSLIKGAFNRAGQGGGVASDAHTERALILKATAARLDSLGNPSWIGEMLSQAGVPLPATKEILDYANTIRGRNNDELIRRSSVMDLDGDGVDEALQQRFSHSCGPAALQIARAEADPVYAWRLHNEAIHSTSTTGAIANEQKSVLEGNGGKAVARGSSGGVGMSIDDPLNDIVSPWSNRSYGRHDLANTNAARTGAVDYMEALLNNGVDVPIRVEWNSGGAHFLMATDVRGTGDNREFLVTDPWTGRTEWIRRADIVNGNTNFFAGTGRLANYYS